MLSVVNQSDGRVPQACYRHKLPSSRVEPIRIRIKHLQQEEGPRRIQQTSPLVGFKRSLLCQLEHPPLARENPAI